MAKKYQIKPLKIRGEIAPKKIIDFYNRECNRAKRAGGTDDEWLRLRVLCDYATDALRENNFTLVMYLMFTIGESVGRMGSVPNWLLAGVKPGAPGDPRMPGFHNIAKNKEKAMKHAAKLASEKWNCDLERSIRIGEMSQLVWAEMHGNALWEKLLPDQATGLNSWIRSVAPAYAQLPGRPKRSK